MFDRWGVWDVLPDSGRRRWSLEPFESVGPLRFGMRPVDVTTALGGIARSPQLHTRAALPENRYGTVKGECWGLGLTFYYGLEERLRGIAVDALKGPQVYADGMALVGRAPSELEQWIVDRSEIREPFSELFYVNLGEPGSASLGVVVCAQRAGDRLLTRPVFLPSEAMNAPKRYLPAEVWTPH
ncbi:hypothetical protein [Streptomyces formicae]|uniref:Uncharacterized protein n=1 Tax=Streptomyces formicae TaxID=1616117 RepID=A0A291QA73_9ACTN|nr:hypothetical protein [Streptomyces formicae]ATL28458.1 hypothetical protein KY5_3440 [Streptomyces formicae]